MNHAEYKIIFSKVNNLDLTRDEYNIFNLLFAKYDNLYNCKTQEIYFSQELYITKYFLKNSLKKLMKIGLLIIKDNRYTINYDFIYNDNTKLYE